MSNSSRQDVSVYIETDSRIRAIEFLFDDDEAPLQQSKGKAVEVFVACLQTRAFEMVSARIFVESVHGIESCACGDYRQAITAMR
jgi:hypothetical protein